MRGRKGEVDRLWQGSGGWGYPKEVTQEGHVFPDRLVEDKNRRRSEEMRSNIQEEQILVST